MCGTKERERTKKTRVEGALERKRGDGASLLISRKREGVVDERNRGMSSRVRTCSRSVSHCMQPARFLSG